MDKLGQIRLFIRRMKWERAETRLGLLGFAFIGAGLTLSKVDPLKSALGEWPWILYIPLALGALLVLVAGFKLWRLVQRPLDIPEIKGPVVRGASAFSPEDGEIFKRLGRQDELAKLRAWILDDQVPVILVMGESGVGKTSLLRAGVQNLLDLDVAYWEAVATDSAEKFQRSIRRQLKKNPNSVDHGVLLVDQAEQLGAGRDVFELLEKHLLKDPPYGVTWILAMRREFLPDWIEWSNGALPKQTAQRVEILPVQHFGRERAREVFSILADEAGVQVREEVLREVIDSVAEGDRVSPVDLAIALQVLARNPAQAEDPRFMLSIGGHSAVLTSYLEGELEIYDADTRGEIFRAVLELIDLENDRRRADGADLDQLAKVARPASMESFSHALDRLAQPGVRVLENQEGRFRLMHERFIPAVRRLAGDVMSAAERASRLLTRRFGHWRSESESKRYLLAGAELQEVESELGRIKWGKDRQEKERFVRDSMQMRRRRRLAAGAGLAAALCGLVIGVRWWQVEQTRRQMQEMRLPLGLYDLLPQVQSLSLQDVWASDLDWLGRAESLKRLGLTARGLKSLEGIPAEVSELTLDFGGSQVTSLAGIPTGVSKLRLDLGFSEVTSLAGIPAGVSELTLDLDGAKVASLVGIPNEVSKLTLNLGGSQVTSLVGIPAGVSELTLNLGGSQVTSLTGIPAGVSELTLDLGWSKVTSLTGIPAGVSELTLNIRQLEVPELIGASAAVLDTSPMSSLVGIPAGVTALNLDLGGSLVASLAGIPTEVTALNLDLGGSLVASLAGIPAGVSELEVAIRESQVTSLAGIPNGVTKLVLDLGRSRVASLEGIPAGVTKLVIDLLESTETDLSFIPMGVSELALDFSRSEVKSLEGIPAGVTKLVLDLRRSKVANLKGTPASVTELALALGGSKVASLEGIPAGVSELEISFSKLFYRYGRSRVTSLSGVPAGVSKLTLRFGESEFTSLSGIPAGVSDLTLDFRRYLEFERPGLRDLEGIPAGVTDLTLDLRRSQVTSLAGIPAGVTKLALDLRQSNLTSLEEIVDRKDLALHLTF